MEFIIKRWRRLRGIVLAITGLMLVLATFREISSGGSWIPVIVISGLFFAFGYSIPFVMRVNAKLNSQLFRMMNPKAIWMQVVLFWLSVLAALLQSAALLFPGEDAVCGRNLEASIGYCACFGLFIGSGNFLAREADRRRQNSILGAESQPINSLPDQHGSARS